MATISAVIITRNEERNIARCLDSLQGLVDEIVVVDSLSTDRTEKICENYSGLRFEKREWQGYSNAKNFANELATGDYILSLDADEALSPELSQEIADLKDQLTGAYWLNRLTNYCGHWIHHSGWYPDYQLRLFPRQSGQWNGAVVHERVILKAPMVERRLQGVVYHYTVYSLSEHIERINQYSSLNAQRVLDKGRGALLLRATVEPFARFVRDYFIKKGFLDGFAGFCVSSLSGFAVFLKYVKAHQLRQDQRKASAEKTAARS